MKKILLPIDGSPRSLRTIQVVKQSYIPAETEITILLVVPDPRPSKLPTKMTRSPPCPTMRRSLKTPRPRRRPAYWWNPLPRCSPGIRRPAALRFGSPGPEIIQFAKEGGFDAILMTRSSRGSTQKLGSVSTYIVQNASFITTTVLREA